MKENLVIVEGFDDKNFIEALLIKLIKEKEIPPNKFAVHAISIRGGKAEFASENAIKTLLTKFATQDPNQSWPKNVLLICDADFRETKEPLCGFKKTQIFLDGLVTNFNKLVMYPNTNFDFFVLPDNKKDGNLESLFLQCATKKITKKSSCVDDYLKCLDEKRIEGEKSLKDPSIHKKDKLRSQLLILAIGIQKNLRQVGEVAAEKHGYWNLDHQSLEPLKTFLKKFT